ASSLIHGRVNFGRTTDDGMQRAGRLIAAAAAISPDHPDVLDSAAWLLRAQDKYQESIAAYQHLVGNCPGPGRGLRQGVGRMGVRWVADAD
ncbi:MAG TPA: hypothetical protein VGH84_05305, partial [Steroidobacteraceae bacterium]